MSFIQEGAIFIADSHYPHHGDEFLELLQKIDRGEIETKQLFLMGDNFDLLFGYNSYIKTFSEDAISLLQKLSKKLEIHYLEGNHDFLLLELFPDIKVYLREEQPVIFSLHSQQVALSHGDRYATGFLYNLYSKILRNRYTILFLRPFEKFIIDYRMRKLSQKSICHHFDSFEKRVGEIVKHYPKVDMIIEGHFHQARFVENYCSLPSLACQQSVGVIRGGKLEFVAIDSL